MGDWKTQINGLTGNGNRAKDDLIRNGSPCHCLTNHGTKEKAYFPTEEKAVLYAQAKEKQFNTQYVAYQCGQGTWHIKTDRHPTVQEATEETFAKPLPLAEAAVLDPVNHHCETREKVRLLFEQGKTKKEMAEMLGVSPACIRKHAIKLGLAHPRPYKKASKPVSPVVPVSTAGHRHHPVATRRGSQSDDDASGGTPGEGSAPA